MPSKKLDIGVVRQLDESILHLAHKGDRMFQGYLRLFSGHLMSDCIVTTLPQIKRLMQPARKILIKRSRLYEFFVKERDWWYATRA